MLAARGKGWNLDADFHALLARTYRAPVDLRPTTIADAGLPDGSLDVVLSVSTIEHFTPEDLAEFASEVRRVLRPGAYLVLTIDLFLDVQPFTSMAASNRYGRNIDIRALLELCDANVVNGERSQLHGFPEFDHEKVLADLSRYMIGHRYPGMSQCLIAQRR